MRRDTDGRAREATVGGTSWQRRLAWALGVVCIGVGQAAADASLWGTLDALVAPRSEGLSVEVLAETVDPDVLVIGDPLAYRLRAEQTGYCYLLHVDSRARATLISPQGCGEADVDRGPVDLTFPATGGLTVDYPEGSDVVYGVLSRDPVPTFEALVGVRGGVAGLSVEDAERVVGQLADSAQSGQLLIASVAYDVAEEPPTTQYTTRGIIRKVVAGRKKPGDSSDLARLSVNNIHFDFGSDRLTAESLEELDQFGAALVSRELDGVRLRVAGHTDDVGDREYNYDLSLRRAVAVKQYLVERYAIDAARLDTVGYGEDQPVFSSGDEEARALNRRVEMVFMDGDSPP